MSKARELAELGAVYNSGELFKTYKWNDAVESKGDRTQRILALLLNMVEAAMTDVVLH